jgi:hypothetical protein
MISLDRVLTYAKSQGFAVLKTTNEDGTIDIDLVDKKKRVVNLIENHTEGDGVDKEMLAMISAETQP